MPHDRASPCGGKVKRQVATAVTPRLRRAIRDWLKGTEVSLAIIPIKGTAITAVRRLRKGLRDVRDRVAQRDHRWRSVAFGGLADGDRAVVLVQQRTIDRDGIRSALERRWADTWMGGPGGIKPSPDITVQDAATLACRRRGVEPLRIVIPGQIGASRDEWNEPMPIAF